MDKNRLFQLELKCKQLQRNRGSKLSLHLKNIKDKFSSLHIKNINFNRIDFNYVLMKLKQIIIWKIKYLSIFSGIGILIVFFYKDYHKVYFEDTNFSQINPFIYIDFNLSDWREYIPFLEDENSSNELNSSEIEFNQTEIPKEIEVTYDLASELRKKEINDILAIDKEINFQNYVLLDYREYRSKDIEDNSMEMIVEEFEDSPPETIVYILDTSSISSREIIDEWGEFYDFSFKRVEQNIKISKNPDIESRERVVFNSKNIYGEVVEKDKQILDLNSSEEWDEFYIFDENFFNKEKTSLRNENKDTLSKNIKVFESNSSKLAIEKMAVPNERVIKFENEIKNRDLAEDETPLNPFEEAIQFSFDKVQSTEITFNESSKNKNVKNLNKEIEEELNVTDFKLFEDSPIITKITFTESKEKNISKSFEEFENFEVPTVESLKATEVDTNEIEKVYKPEFELAWNGFKLFEEIVPVSIKRVEEIENVALNLSENNISLPNIESREITIDVNRTEENYCEFGVIGDELIDINITPYKKSRNSVINFKGEKESNLNIENGETNLSSQKDINTTSSETESRVQESNLSTNKTESKDLNLTDVLKTSKIEKINNPPKELENTNINTKIEESKAKDNKQENLGFEVTEVKDSKRVKPENSIKPAEEIELKKSDIAVESKSENRYNTIFLSPIIILK
jgi:hypothetical protein